MSEDNMLQEFSDTNQIHLMLIMDKLPRLFGEATIIDGVNLIECAAYDIIQHINHAFLNERLAGELNNA
ncbi:MAG: hypothetical protein WCY09_08655 [Candidatus Omnitrophota bacterium]